MQFDVEAEAFGVEAEVGARVGSADHAGMDPIPVRIVGQKDEQIKPATYVSWSSWSTGQTQPINLPIQILPQTGKRKTATIRVMPGLLAANLAGNIRVGTREEVQAGQGGFITVNQNFDYTAQNEVWLMGDGTNDLLITVKDERYA